MPHTEPMSGMTLGVILNMTSFGLATFGLIGVAMLAAAAYRAPTRPCHRCGRRVPLSRRVCRDCGYEFAPVRFTR
jgi:ribosomal protein L40E